MPRLSKIGAAALAAFGWTGLSSVTANYLVVAGGGAGGTDTSGGFSAGGGGAGGYQASTTSLVLTTSYTVTVGAGGATAATSGSNSSFGSLTASVGGGSGGYVNSSDNGANGGSGGGGGSVNGTGGSPTTSQGYAGGTGTTAANTGGGGGGGAGAVGGAGSGSVGGNGGNGAASSISGSSVTYAGGGGGGAGFYVSGRTGTGGTGGSGGGGNGSGTGAGTAGTANLGSGGGGSRGGYISGGAGGSGVVIISYPSPQKFGGGIVTTSGSNTIHIFQTSGTLSPLSSLTASALIVAGGGGASGAGGGAGGMQTPTGITIDTNSIYVVTVGAGGTGINGNTVGNNGSNSIFSAYATASVGGGGGGCYNGVNGVNGGSGGGGGGSSGATSNGGTATAGQGNNGGTGFGTGGRNPSGGGGGAGAVGGNATSASTSTGGAGGAGLSSSISGTATYYAGGGGGSGDVSSAGGIGGGGAATTTGAGIAGTPNTGGGGGGVFNAYTPGQGGSGIVIISYAGSVQQMAGGTVTISGGNVIHTFTSSGYLTPLKYVGNSLRFRNSASAYLSRTPTTAGNTQKWTMSFWLKRGSLSQPRSGVYSTTGVVDYIEFGGGYGNYDFEVTFNNASGARIATNALYRDPAAWYHFVIATDTTQSTASNRILLYVNGVQITSFVSASYPSQNYNTAINSAVAQYIGADYSLTSGQYFDGYMAEYNFIDGQQLTPNSFGTFNSYGVWQPITYGGSYGTNGFYLPFTNKTSTTTLGYDFSPNGNNWTPNNISLTTGSTYDSMTDVPTLTSTTAANYATFNPLIRTDSGSPNTLSNGNLKMTATSASYGDTSLSTIAPSTGKWYVEFTLTAASYPSAEIFNMNYPANFGVSGNGRASLSPYGYGYLYNGNKQNNGTATAYGSTFTTGDIISVALDMDNGKVWFGKNGTWQASGNPAAGTNAAFTGLSGSFAIGFCDSQSGSNESVNFGQQPWAYTIPSGFVALNTYNL